MRIVNLDRIKSVLPNVDLLSEIESGFAAYISRILIALEFSLGILILLPFQLKRIVVPLTTFVLFAFCIHLTIQIYLQLSKFL